MKILNKMTINQISIRDFLVDDIELLIDTCINSYKELGELKKRKQYLHWLIVF